jgi:hypothetical protein
VDLLPLSRPAIQDAEAEVAMGLEWAHAELVGQGEGLAVVARGQLCPRGLAMCRNVAEQAQGIRLVPAFLSSGNRRSIRAARCVVSPTAE